MHNTKIKAGIIGGAGYTGGELMRLLVNHPSVEIAFVHSKSNAEKFLHEIHADLLGETDIKFSGGKFNEGELAKKVKIDVLFLCVGHGDAITFLEQENEHFKGVKVIDLSQDFRLAKNARFGERNFTYGLPELQREAIKHAQNIANPGCFATALQVGLLPLAKQGLLQNVHATGITGSTGAGQSLAPTSHFSWRANNISAYKTLSHQHLKEIKQSLQLLQPGYACEGKGNIYFVPWRGDFTRGIYISSMVDCSMPATEVIALYKDYFCNHPFTHVSEKMIDLKQVVNTNKCLLHIEGVDGKLVVHAAIDNLLKGASGQAVQNMNLMFGLDETAGLRLKANYF